jgi:hypothetical protein
LRHVELTSYFRDESIEGREIVLGPGGEAAEKETDGD